MSLMILAISVIHIVRTSSQTRIISSAIAPSPFLYGPIHGVFLCSWGIWGKGSEDTVGEFVREKSMQLET